LNTQEEFILLHLVTMKTCRYLLSDANSYENKD